MANLCIAALQKLREIVLAVDGINVALIDIGIRDMVHLPPLEESNVFLQNAPPELVDENEPAVYPSLFLYCDEMDNQLLRKFSRFSGPIRVVAEMRVSGERIAGLDQQLSEYVEALSEVLANHQGEWTENLVFNGAYKARFREIGEGGLNFIQTAAIEIELKGFA